MVRWQAELWNFAILRQLCDATDRGFFTSTRAYQSAPHFDNVARPTAQTVYDFLLLHAIVHFRDGGHAAFLRGVRGRGNPLNRVFTK